MKNVALFGLLWFACSQPQEPVNSNFSSSDVPRSGDAVAFSHKLPWPAGLTGSFTCSAHAKNNSVNSYVPENIPAYDFPGAVGTSRMRVLATTNGIVRVINRSNTDGSSCYQKVANGSMTFNECWKSANYVIIAFPDNAPDAYKNREAVYFHLANVNPALQEGDYVRQGTYLGQVGTSGYSTGFHLHYHIQNKATQRTTIWDNRSIVFRDFEEFSENGMTNNLGNGYCYKGGYFPTPKSDNIEVEHDRNAGPAAIQTTPVIQPIVLETPVAASEPDPGQPSTPREPVSAPPGYAANTCFNYPENTISEQFDVSSCSGEIQSAVNGKRAALRKLMLATCFSRSEMGNPSAATGSDAPGGCSCIGWVLQKYSPYCAGTESHVNFACVATRYPNFNADHCPSP